MSVIVKNTLNGQQYVLKFETKLNRPNIQSSAIISLKTSSLCTLVIAVIITFVFIQERKQEGYNRSEEDDVHAVSAGGSSVFSKVWHRGGLHWGHDQARAESERYLQEHGWVIKFPVFV